MNAERDAVADIEVEVEDDAEKDVLRRSIPPKVVSVGWNGSKGASEGAIPAREVLREWEEETAEPGPVRKDSSSSRS